jgi:hypothetical protein
MRCTLSPGPGAVCFNPARLSDAQMSEVIQKRAALGAAFLGCFDKLPTTHSGLVWEAEIVLTPPSHLRPAKPKMWLLGQFTAKPDTFYQL